MSKLSDAPELKAAFNKAANDFGLSDHEFSRGIAEHFFLAGRDSLRDECDSVKPKRKIVQVYLERQALFAISDDGKLFLWSGLTGQFGWLPYPDLPQED